jgi:hypothetical protein
VGLIILISILMYGIMVTPVMRLLDGRCAHDPDGNGARIGAIDANSCRFSDAQDAADRNATNSGR